MPVQRRDVPQRNCRIRWKFGNLDADLPAGGVGFIDLATGTGRLAILMAMTFDDYKVVLYRQDDDPGWPRFRPSAAATR